MPSSTPSVFLPSLHPSPPPSVLSSHLSCLSALYFPSNVLVDLRIPVPVLLDEALTPPAKEEEEEDHFERDFARGWCERVVAIASRALARGAEEFEMWEEVVDQASGLLANLSGHGAQGSSTSTYLLPSPPSCSTTITPSLPTPPATQTDSSPSPPPSSASTPASISLTIRDTTLLQNSTGHRTWGSAALLAQRIASSPSSFFHSTSSSSSSPATSTARPLRVLELGSGTGLVGLTAAAVLSRLYSSSASSAAIDDSSKPLVTLADGGSEPAAVLDNLASNVALNSSALEGIRVEVRELDWRDFLPEKGKTVDEEDKYDVIFAADVAYEPGMAEALHAAVAGLLRFPTSPLRPPSSASSPLPPHLQQPPSPAFHLIFPLRRTHTAETASVSRLFPPSPSSYPPSPVDSSLSRTHPITGGSYRLVSTSTEEITGPDGFGGAGGGSRRGRRAAPEGEVRYRVLRVEWEEIEQ